MDGTEACQVGKSIKLTVMADVFSCGCVYVVFLTRENGWIHSFGDDIREGNQVNLKSKFI